MQGLHVEAARADPRQVGASSVVHRGPRLALEEVRLVQHFWALRLVLHVADLRDRHEAQAAHDVRQRGERQRLRQALGKQEERKQQHCHRPKPQDQVKHDPLVMIAATRERASDAHDGQLCRAIAVVSGRRRVLVAAQVVLGHAGGSVDLVLRQWPQQKLEGVHHAHHEGGQGEGQRVPQQVPDAGEFPVMGNPGVPPTERHVMYIGVAGHMVGLLVVADHVLHVPRGGGVEQRRAQHERQLVQHRNLGHGEVRTVVRHVGHEQPRREGQREQCPAFSRGPATPGHHVYPEDRRHE
eukprot:scaffold1833_cov255-Pinguiococcus_pyrenoidosus.AAC.9